MPIITLITPFRAETDSRAKRLAAALETLGFKAIITSVAGPQRGGRITRRLRQYLRITRAIASCRGTIICVNAEVASIAAVLRAFLFWRQLKIVADIYDHHSFIFTGRLGRVFNFVENFALKHSDATIIPIKERLDQYKPKLSLEAQNRVFFISNLGFPGKHIKGAQPFKPAGHPVMIAYAGTIDQGRGLPQLAAVRSQFPNISVRIYGSGPFLEEFLKNSDFRSVYQGPFTADLLPSIYQNSDIIYACYETFVENNKYCDPNKLREAYTFNRPMITNAGTPLGTIVAHRHIGVTLSELTSNSIDKAVHTITAAAQTIENNLSSTRHLIEVEQQENLRQLERLIRRHIA